MHASSRVQRTVVRNVPWFGLLLTDAPRSCLATLAAALLIIHFRSQEPLEMQLYGAVVSRGHGSAMFPDALQKKFYVVTLSYSTGY